MKEVREKILVKLMHGKGSHFCELWDKEIESNVFAYHLKVLEKEEFVKKDDLVYTLTTEGKRYVTMLDGKTGKKSTQPVLIAAIIIFDEKDRVLMLQRKKQPFLGWWALPAGKIEEDEFVLEAAKRELFEETGLSGDLELKGHSMLKTFKDDNQVYNVFMYIVRCRNFKGELVKENREGKLAWVALNQLDNIKCLLDDKIHIEIAKGDSYKVVQLHRVLGDEEEHELDCVRYLV